MKNLLLVGLLAFTSNAFAAFINIDASYSGNYSNTGTRNGLQSNIFSGTYAGSTYRNWIAFDLSAIEDDILSASLTIYNSASNDPDINFVWSEVTTSASEVLTDAGDGVDTYNDLKDGVIFASGVATPGANNVFDLTGAAISSLNNASNFWIMGGSTAGDLGEAFGYTNGVGSNDLIRLSLVTQAPQAVVPIPAAFWLFGSGLIGVVGVARRRSI